jgi:hypothetical protein
VLFPLYTHAHTFKKKKKKNFALVIRGCRRDERDVCYIWYQSGSTHGFATAFVDMIRFDYTVVDRVDCVRAGNHG